MNISTHPERVAAGSTAAPDNAAASGRILVWDWPTRIGHWLLAGSFAAYGGLFDAQAGVHLPQGAGIGVVRVQD